MARQREQPPSVLQQNDSFACDLPGELPVLLLRQGRNLHRIIEEPEGKHTAQDAAHLVIDGSQTHLPRLDCLEQTGAEVLCGGHI